jgi:hypothetical protein|tara:strand:- start:755 stop:940 length:186 start_codon:yes stop_codon:yes gene_type:complete
MIEYFKEITVWDTNIPNHTYMIDKSGHLVGYIKTGTTEEIIFNKPMKQFSRTRRKFVKLKR